MICFVENGVDAPILINAVRTLTMLCHLVLLPHMQFFLKISQQLLNVECLSLNGKLALEDDVEVVYRGLLLEYSLVPSESDLLRVFEQLPHLRQSEIDELGQIVNFLAILLMVSLIYLDY